MPEKNRRLMDLTATVLLAVVFLKSTIITNAADSSVAKLKEDPIKCTPCLQNPPPPPPPPKKSHCPPSPKESYFPPPPPPPPTYVYSPPPPPTYVYASPPGDLYPVDHDFGAAAAGPSFTTVKLIALGVIGFMIL